MHDCTFLIWVIPAVVTVIFAIISGWINIYVSNEANDKSIIRDQRKLIIKERLEMWKISTIFTAATIITAGLFLYWAFSTEKLSFSSPASGANAACTIVLIVFGVVITVAFLNFVYVIAGSVRESIVARRYSKIYRTRLITAHQ